MADEKLTEGILRKGIGGFYYVETATGLYECKARGNFRNRKITPLVGDRVLVTIQDSDAENRIEDILPRKNSLKRPPLANLDRLFIVVSSCQPNPNLFVIDRMTVLAVKNSIEPVIVLNKPDLSDVRKLSEIYSHAGFKTIITNGVTGEGVDGIKALFKDKVSAFTGNSGVGKSTILNHIDPDLDLPTAEISVKLGRGRHTTRECVLLKVGGGYVADTPGFASLDFDKDNMIMKDDLAEYFPDFAPYLGKCRFSTSCTHRTDKGCAITEAVDKGEIERTRYESYLRMYDEVKDINEWQLKKRK